MKQNIKVNIFVFWVLQKFPGQNDIKVEKKSYSSKEMDIFIIYCLPVGGIILLQNKVNECCGLILMFPSAHNNRSKFEKIHVDNLMSLIVLPNFLKIYLIPTIHSVRQEPRIVLIIAAAHFMGNFVVHARFLRLILLRSARLLSIKLDLHHKFLLLLFFSFKLYFINNISPVHMLISFLIIILAFNCLTTHVFHEPLNGQHHFRLVTKSHLISTLIFGWIPSKYMLVRKNLPETTLLIWNCLLKKQVSLHVSDKSLKINFYLL